MFDYRKYLPSCIHKMKEMMKTKIIVIKRKRAYLRFHFIRQRKDFLSLSLFCSINKKRRCQNYEREKKEIMGYYHKQKKSLFFCFVLFFVRERRCRIVNANNNYLRRQSKYLDEIRRKTQWWILSTSINTS